MQTSFRQKIILALLCFGLAACLSWWTRPLPDRAPQQSLVSASAVSLREKDSVSTTSEFTKKGLAALEGNLQQILEPNSVICDGATLAALCKEPLLNNIPGAPAAFTYAFNWAKQDARGMFEWFKARGVYGLPTNELNSSFGFIQAIFSEWGKLDPTAAWAATQEIIKDEDRANALESLIRGAGKEHAASITQASEGLLRLQSSKPSSSDRIFAAVIGSLFKVAPEAARALAGQYLPQLGASTEGGMGRTLFSAYGEDYLKHWEFLSSLPAGSDRGKLLGRFMNDVTSYHREESIKLWEQAPLELRKEMAGAGFLGMSGRSDFGETDGQSKFAGLADLIEERVAQNPDEQEYARRYLNIHGADMMKTDPAAAVEWSLRNLHGEYRVNSTAGLFRSVNEDNFATSLEAWQSLPDGVLKSRALGTFFVHAPERDWKQLLPLAQATATTDRVHFEEGARSRSSSSTAERLEQVLEKDKPEKGG